MRPEAESLAPEPRSYFPETLLYLPEVLLDERGEAEVVFPMADALTEWRIDAVFSTRAGSVAHAETSIVSRQTFEVDLHAPAFVRAGDEVELAAAVRNDGAGPVAARVALEREPWFEPLSPLEAPPVEVGPGEVAAARFRVRAIRPGEATATIRAICPGGPSDAARRPILVLPAGRLVAAVRNGELSAGAAVARVSIAPPGEDEATDRALELRLTPSPLAEAIEGIETLLRKPTGCFEQTSATTWPNTLVLGYLRTLPERRPDLEERALGLVRAGYQRLCGFEVGGGGFSLYGQAPAVPWLTAWGLREFVDLGREIPVDPELIARTRRFLLSTQRPDGSFAVVGRSADRDGDPGAPRDRLAATAYVLAALVEAGERGEAVDRAGKFVTRATLDDDVPTYTLALAAEALADWGRRPEVLGRAAAELAARGRPVDLGGKPGVRFDAGRRSLAGGYGGRADVETAAIAARVLSRLPDRLDLARDTLRALVHDRELGGGWGPTQTTVQALSTLVRAAPLRAAARGTVEVLAGGAPLETIVLGAARDRSVAVRLGDRLPRDGRLLEVELRGTLEGIVAYQLVASARVPWESEAAAAAEPVRSRGAERGKPRLSVAARYDAAAVRTGAALGFRLEIANEGEGPAAAPLVEVPFPAGFELATDAPLARATADGWLGRHDEVGSGLVLYLRDLAPGERRALDLRVVARHAGRLASGAVRAYPYYNPEDAALVRPVRIEVSR